MRKHKVCYWSILNKCIICLCNCLMVCPSYTINLWVRSSKKQPQIGHIIPIFVFQYCTCLMSFVVESISAQVLQTQQAVANLAHATIAIDNLLDKAIAISTAAQTIRFVDLSDSFSNASQPYPTTTSQHNRATTTSRSCTFPSKTLKEITFITLKSAECQPIHGRKTH